MKLHPYQEKAAQFMLENPYSALFADPGMGKTIITLTMLTALEAVQPLKVLIVAPLHPMRTTWPDEIRKWGHTRGLRFQICHGKDKSPRVEDHDVFLVNPEGLGSLLAFPHSRILNTLIIDESTKFKSWSAVRTKVLKGALPQFSRRHILTGTPTPNSLLDLFSQIYLVDGGRTFGRAYTRFRSQYFHPRSHIVVGGRQVVSSWDPNPGAKEAIYQAIEPVCCRLDGEDLLDLPDFVFRDVAVELPPKAAATYKTFQEELFVQLDKGNYLKASSAGSAYGMCRQAAGGAVYLQGQGVAQLHSEKVKALCDIVEELNGKPVLVAFNYRHERDRIVAALPEARVIDGQTTTREATEIIRLWNEDKVPILLGHPQSIGHGVNLQYGSGRHVVWFTQTDNMENYEQFNRRIRRQGVTSNVFVHHIIARNTIDVAIARRVAQKGAQQKSLLDALRDWQKEC